MSAMRAQKRSGLSPPALNDIGQGLAGANSHPWQKTPFGNDGGCASAALNGLSGS
jgi:hypothetical protein